MLLSYAKGIDGMVFVGREKETRQIVRALEKGGNVIITGKFGMGRTKLVRYVADNHGEDGGLYSSIFRRPPARYAPIF
ncbi:MAG: ATP-binding protein [Syntrophobacterales bacterium]|nr:ATP-binding protein [Syntrophobacterales bacterium]